MQHLLPEIWDFPWGGSDFKPLGVKYFAGLPWISTTTSDLICPKVHLALVWGSTPFTNHAESVVHGQPTILDISSRFRCETLLPFRSLPFPCLPLPLSSIHSSNIPGESQYAIFQNAFPVFRYSIYGNGKKCFICLIEIMNIESIIVELGAIESSM